MHESSQNPTPLRVAQVIGTYAGGGAQRQAASLVHALADRGHHSLGIAVREEGAFAETSASRHRFLSLGADDRGVFSLVASIARLRSVIRRERIEVLHVHGSYSLPLTFAACIGLRNPPKIVFIWHDSGIVWSKGMPGRHQRMAIRRCAALLGSSRAVADWLRGIAPDAAVDVFHGGVPIADASVAAQVPMMAWVGRWVAGKVPHLLIEAAARLRREGLLFQATMVGPCTGSRTTFLEEHRRMVSDLGLDGIVELPGEMDDGQLSMLLSRSQIAVQTSDSEGLSMAVLEQMARGLAIVATDVGDTRVALANGECGVLVPTRDLDALTDALRLVVTDRELRERLAMKARERAIAEYSLEAMARNAEAVYRSVLPGEWSSRRLVA